MDAGDVHRREELFDIEMFVFFLSKIKMSKYLLVCECGNLMDLALAHPETISIQKHDLVLSGFNLVLSVSLFLDHNSIIHSFAVREESSTILASSVALSSSPDSITVDLAKQIDLLENVYPFELPDGILLVGELDVDSSDLLQVPNGEYDVNVPTLIRNINLKRLGCDVRFVRLILTRLL